MMRAIIFKDLFHNQLLQDKFLCKPDNLITDKLSKMHLELRSINFY